MRALRGGKEQLNIASRRERDLLSFFRILFFTFFLFRTHHMKINKNEKKKRASVDSSTKYTHDKLQQAGRQARLMTRQTMRTMSMLMLSEMEERERERGSKEEVRK